jgi:hypothetical protein
MQKILGPVSIFLFLAAMALSSARADDAGLEARIAALEAQLAELRQILMIEAGDECPAQIALRVCDTVIELTPRWISIRAPDAITLSAGKHIGLRSGQTLSIQSNRRPTFTGRYGTQK